MTTTTRPRRGRGGDAQAAAMTDEQVRRFLTVLALTAERILGLTPEQAAAVCAATGTAATKVQG
jgi:hypothetical protein